MSSREGVFDMDLGGPRPLHAGSIGLDAKGAAIAGMTITAPSPRFDSVLENAQAELLSTTALLSSALASGEAVPV